MSRFAEIANKVASEVERPVLAPPGVYELRVTNTPAPIMQSFASGEFEKISFSMLGVNVIEVDDQEALTTAGGAGAVRVNHDFLLDLVDDAAAAKAEYRLKTFLTEHLGLDASLTLGQLVSIAKGATCYGTITHRVDKNDDSVLYYQLNKTMPVT